MISIATPLYSVEQVYIACVERTQDLVLRAALKTEGKRVMQRSEEYLSKAASENLYSMAPINAQNVSNAKLADLYDRVLVNGGERSTYDKLRSAARFGRCPLCGQRDVKTLDHYLPSSTFPEFCITPVNLVPCCSDCNKTKLDYVANCYDKQGFHPYFDDWSSVILLKATPIIADRVDIVFSINKHLSVEPHWIKRAEWHFQKLHLGNLYREHASVELVQRKRDFRATFLAAGSFGLEEDLKFEAVSRNTPFPNGWQPTLYRGLAASKEFCEGGFEKIEE